MTNKETQIKSSPIRGLFFLVVTAGMSFLGYRMLLDGDEFILKLFGFVILFAFPMYLYMIITTGFGGEGPCPICNSRIQILVGTESDILCKVCNTYLDAKNKTLKEIDIHSLSKNPVFAVPTPWTDIASARSPTIALSKEDFIMDEILIRKEGVRLLDAHWPQECCVCGRNSTNEQTLTNKFIYTPPGVIRTKDKEVTVVANGIPYCDEHKNGVKFGNVNFANPPKESGFGLLFRSYEYRNKFLKLNPWKWV